MVLLAVLFLVALSFVVYGKFKKLTPKDVEKLYIECASKSGEDFYGCVNESCIDTELKRAFYNAWRDELLNKPYGSPYITEGYFKEHFRVASIEITDKEKFMDFRIYFTFTQDWMQLRDGYLIRYDKPLKSTPSYEDMRDKMEHLPVYNNNAIRSMIMFKKIPISLSDLNSLIDRGYLWKRINYDFCAIRPYSDNDYPVLQGFATLSLTANVCVDSEINLFTGEVKNIKTVCMID